MKVPAVLEIARAKEGRSKPPVGENAFRDGLSNCGLASPGEPVQPVEGGSIGVLGPRLDVIQDNVPGPFETALALAMSELGPSGAATIVQDRQLSCWFMSLRHSEVGLRLTYILQGPISVRYSYHVEERTNSQSVYSSARRLPPAGRTKSWTSELSSVHRSYLVLT